MNISFVSGFFLSLSLIVAIGPQNAFILRQGLLRQHVLLVALFCAISDIILILLGIFGFGSLILEISWLSSYMFIVGGIWLLGYGLLRLKDAYVGDSYLEISSTNDQDLNVTLTNCAALTWLNPHVYIDTLVMIGTISTQYEDAFQFGLGACLASSFFFFTLAFGARALSPIMKSRKAWQSLDVIIAMIMFTLSLSMFSESF